MDVIDDATKTETQFQKMALANQLARVKAVAGKHSKTHCQECGDAIPTARREAIRGCLYCTHCQAEKE